MIGYAVSGASLYLASVLIVAAITKLAAPPSFASTLRVLYPRAFDRSTVLTTGFGLAFATCEAATGAGLLAARAGAVRYLVVVMTVTLFVRVRAGRPRSDP